jgi:hypothetical protein
LKTEQALQLPFTRASARLTQRVLQVVRELAADSALPSSERNERIATLPEAAPISSNERRVG